MFLRAINNFFCFPHCDRVFLLPVFISLLNFFIIKRVCLQVLAEKTSCAVCCFNFKIRGILRKKKVPPLSVRAHHKLQKYRIFNKVRTSASEESLLVRTGQTTLTLAVECGRLL